MDENLLKKIKRLLALQESAQKMGSIEEAANAASKVRDLLMKHNLDLYSVQKWEERPKEEQIDKAEFDTSTLSTKVEGDWVRQLAEVISRFNMCRVIGTGHSRGIIFIIGTPTNTQITWYTVEQLVVRIRGMAKEAFKVYRGAEKRNTFIRGYLRGAIEGIGKKLGEERAREQFQAQQDRESGLQNTNALMVVGMGVQMMSKVESYMKSNFRLKTKATSSLSSTGGRAMGKEAGYRMGIHKGVAGSASTVKRLS